MARRIIEFYAAGDHEAGRRATYRYLAKAQPGPRPGTVRVTFTSLGPPDQPGVVPSGFNDITTDSEVEAFAATQGRLGSVHDRMKSFLVEAGPAGEGEDPDAG